MRRLTRQGIFPKREKGIFAAEFHCVNECSIKLDDLTGKEERRQVVPRYTIIFFRKEKEENKTGQAFERLPCSSLWSEADDI